jgi:hypothetical protein
MAAMCGCLVLSFACAPPPVANTADELAVEDLPPYDAEAAELFDDSVAPEVFGFKVDRSSVLNDSIFRERVAKADQIQAVRLSTIQQDKVGLAVRYRLILAPLPPALAGEPLSPETELQVGLGSPSLNLIRSMDLELVGKEFIVLLKAFRLSGKAVWHFSAEPNTAPIRDAILKLRAEADR